MHGEKFERARTEFDRLISEYPNETELVDRASVLIQACDKRIQEAGVGPKLKGANDYYDVAVAEMNSGALEEARQHLEHALELLPRADHVLYALAALSALSGERAKALDYLSRAIERREENRFLAVNDADFESLSQDPEFRSLVSSGPA
jgi:tetratricopeptide (TPR) repeat protein